VWVVFTTILRQVSLKRSSAGISLFDLENGSHYKPFSPARDVVRLTPEGARVQIESSRGVSFKFCRPSGAPGRKPSIAMTRALQALTESDEMRQFVVEAHAQRKVVVVEVFQNRAGRPLLIHPNVVPKT
jgi:hypothetical protein